MISDLRGLDGSKWLRWLVWQLSLLVKVALDFGRSEENLDLKSIACLQAQGKEDATTVLNMVGVEHMKKWPPLSGTRQMLQFLWGHYAGPAHGIVVVDALYLICTTWNILKSIAGPKMRQKNIFVTSNAKKQKVFGDFSIRTMQRVGCYPRVQLCLQMLIDAVGEFDV